MSDITPIRRLINRLQDLFARGASIVSVIRRCDVLMRALEDLDNLVEMDEVKASIIQQIQIQLVQASGRSGTTGPKFDTHKLHTLFSGPPGVGKTKAAKILARLWDGMGVIDELVVPPVEATSLPSIPPDPPYLERAADVAWQAGDLLVHLTNFQTSFTKLYDAYVPRTAAFHTLQHMIQVPPLQKTSPPVPDILVDMALTHNETWTQVERRNASLAGMCIALIETCQPRDDHPFTPSCSSVTRDSCPFPVPDLPCTLDTVTPCDDINDRYVVATRKDFVAEFCGQTGPKTSRFLTAHLGKVVIVEEGYTLCMSPRDEFGMDALTEINVFMDKHPRGIILIFNGYRKIMVETIFAAQPGLKRRFQWTFDVKGYSAQGLGEIFQRQVHEIGWTMDPTNLTAFFSKHKASFPAFGGDTERLVFQCKLAFGDDVFGRLYDETMAGDATGNIPFHITAKQLEMAFASYLRNRAADEEEHGFLGMYT